MNDKKIRELTINKAHCANTVIHLMRDPDSRAAVQAAIDFGNGIIGLDQLKSNHGKAAEAVKLAVATAEVSNLITTAEDIVKADIAAAFAALAARNATDTTIGIDTVTKNTNMVNDLITKLQNTNER